MNDLADDNLEETIELESEEEVEAVEETEVEEPEAEEVQEEATEEPEAEQAEESDEDDEVVVQIGEDAPPTEEETQPAPEWVKEVRKSNRELQRRNKELEAKLAEQEAETNPAPAQMAKPTLDDHNYDVNAYEQALAEYYQNQRAVEEAQAAEQAKLKEAEQIWQNKLEGYAQKRQELKVRDYEAAEHAVEQKFDNTQQGIILEGAENPALVVYALGKNPKKAEELAKIANPVNFAFAVAKLETQLKVTNRKAKAQPEKSLTSGTKVAGAVDSTLERLREEAAKTGNFDKVMKYKRSLKAAKS